MNTQMMNEITEVTRENPYMGPLSFTEDDKPWFFGRTKETNSLFSLLMARGLVLFYAQSGAGKTSLLNAGLIPTIREQTDDQFEILPVCRVGGQHGREAAAILHNWKNPFVFNLLASMEIEVALEDVPLAQRTLPHFLSCLMVEEDRLLLAETSPAKRAPMVLIIDQFEEIFTHHIRLEQERVEFFQQLAAAIEENSQLYVVLAMREDYLARINPYVHLLPDSLRARFYMQRLQKEAALQAVCKPVEKLRPFNVDAAETLVNCLGRDVDKTAVSNGNPHLIIEAMQLQVVCYALWRLLQTQKEPDELISLKDIAWAAAKQHKDAKNLTGETAVAAFVKNALGRYYEEAIDELKTMMPELILRQWFSAKLITDDGTRGLQLWKNDQIPEPVMESLDTQWHLVQVVLRDKSKFVELVHDSFIAPVRKANRQWYEKLERDIPWLNQALDFAHDPTNRSLLLTDFNRLQAAKEERDHVANKRDGLPGGLQEQLDSFLAESQAGLDRQLAQDITWINHAYKYAETKDDALLLSDRAALENAIALVKKKKQQGGLPIEVDNFLEACQEAERRREERRRKEAIKAKNKELENQRVLAEAAEAKRQAEMERAEAHRRQAEAAEARHIAEKGRANLEAMRAKEAKIAAAKQGALLRWAILGGFVAFIFFVIAAFSSISATANENLANTRQAEAVETGASAQLAEAAATKALATAVVDRQIAEEAVAIATAALSDANSAKATAVAAEKNTLAFLAINEAQGALEKGEWESVLLFSRFASKTVSEINAENLAAGVSTNDINGTLLTALSQVNQTIGDGYGQAFREQFRAPNNVGFISNLHPGPQEGTMASVTEGGLYVWSAAASDATQIALPFTADTVYTIAPDGRHLAFVERNAQIHLYKFDPEKNSFLPVGSSITLALPDRFNDYEIDKMAFDATGNQLGFLACNNTNCLVARQPLEGEDLHFCRLSFKLSDPNLVFLSDNTLLVSSYSNKEGTRLLRLTVEDQGEACEIDTILQSLEEITHLAISPESKIVMTAGGGQLQWWRVEEGDQLVPASSAVNLAARIDAVIPLNDQPAFAILDENKQITQYSADFDAQQLSQWACAAAGRDLNASEWTALNSGTDLLDFDPGSEGNYQSVCPELNYPLHISFAEQTLLTCRPDAFDMAHRLFDENGRQAQPFKSWAMSTLLNTFFNERQTFNQNECWDFVSGNFPEYGQIQTIAQDLDGLNLTVTENVQELRSLLRQISSRADFPALFTPHLRAQYERSCADQEYLEECRLLAEFLPRLLPGEEVVVNLVVDGQYFRFDGKNGDVIDLTAVVDDSNYAPYLILLSEDGNYVAESSYEESSQSANIAPFIIPDSGAYLVRVIDANSGGELDGRFTLSLTEIEPTPLEVDQEQLITNETAKPMWAIEGDEGQLVTISLHAESVETLLPAFSIKNQQGVEVSRSQPTAGGQSVLTILPEDGRFYVQPLADFETGAHYTLSAESAGEAASLPSVPAENPVTIVPGFNFFQISNDILFGPVSISLTSANSSLAIFDAAGNRVFLNNLAPVLSQSDTFINNLAPVLSQSDTFILAESKTYYLRLYNSTGEEESVEIVIEALENVEELPVGSGEYETTNNRFWTFTATVGDQYRINMNSLGDFPLDTYLVLYNEEGELVAINDDSNGTLNASLNLKIEKDGRYYLHTRGYDFNEGAYELIVSSRSQKLAK